MNRKLYKIIATGDVLLKYTQSDEKKFYKHKEKIEQIWKKICKQKQNKLFNDDVLSFVNISRINKKTLVEGMFVKYKLVIADRKDPSLCLQINPIGVSGVVMINEHNEKYLLFSVRSSEVSEYPGYLELVPSGHIDKSIVRKNRIVDYKSKLIQEFEEETALSVDLINKIRTLGIVMDTVNRVYDICCVLEVNTTRENILVSFKKVSEYVKPEFISYNKLPNFIKSNYHKIIPTSLAIIKGFNFLNSEDDHI